MLLARVERGMWLAECECRNAIGLAPIAGAEIRNVDWPLDTTVFNCKLCGLVSAISMPAERAEIEAILIARPEANRNWYPYETIADLKLENASHHKELI